MSANPPAFPLHPGINPDWVDCRSTGMSLRDYFAGQIIAGRMNKGFATSVDADVCARVAYQIADAMLAEREKRS